MIDWRYRDYGWRVRIDLRQWRWRHWNWRHAALGLGGAAAVFSLAALWLLFLIYAPGPHASPRLVYFAPGANFVQIARQLDEAGVLRSERLFRRGLLWLGLARSLRAGEYRIPARVNMVALTRFLLNGQPVLYPVRVIEGQTSEQIVAALRANPLLRGALEAIPPEGSLLPETYLVARDTPRQEVVARMQQAMQEAVDEIWRARPPDLPLRNAQELVILASIIEKETGQKGERALVSAVFFNRLRRNMRLQSDPTVIYGLVGGKGALGRPLRQSELNRRTPYNTYRFGGLPPTPIANPGLASLRAAAAPAAENYLYFVADGSGGHMFAATLAEHNRNVANWRKWQRKQKAK